ncbi:MAG TPA: VWA domain-containing protein [Candidatus Sulfotelmatobacter sp.]|nr:VWA domain-containing protein [Candidatus Sulfotelmatobacter sp.]
MRCRLWSQKDLLIALAVIAGVAAGQNGAWAAEAMQASSSAPQAGTQQGNPGAQTGSPAPGGTAVNPPNSQAQPQSPISAEPVPDQDAGTFVFRKQVDEVVLHATVVDGRGELAAHLDRNAFSVFEDGQPQTITSFRRQDVPVAMGIVVDNSGSMRDKRSEVNRAVLNLIRASNPEDEVFVVNFSENSYLDQDFTSNIGLLERALNQTTMQGTTALYDAIVASARHLMANPRLDKKVLLVITDGEDNMSRNTIEEAEQYLEQKNGPTVYAIGLTGQQAQGREALLTLANATGGAAYFPSSLDQVSDITTGLARDIRNQYVIAYQPHVQDPNANYHPIKVVANATGYSELVVRTRNGIYTGESVR